MLCMRMYIHLFWNCIFFGIPYSHVVWWCIVNIMSNYECWISNSAHYHKWEISLFGLRSHAYWSKIMGQFHFFGKKIPILFGLFYFCFWEENKSCKGLIAIDLCFMHKHMSVSKWLSCSKTWLMSYWNFLVSDSNAQSRT